MSGQENVGMFYLRFTDIKMFSIAKLPTGANLRRTGKYGCMVTNMTDMHRRNFTVYAYRLNKAFC